MTTTQIGSAVEKTEESKVDAGSVHSPAEAEEKDNSPTDTRDTEDVVDEAEAVPVKRRTTWSRVVAYGLLPGLALLLAVTAGWLKWQDSSLRVSETSMAETLKAATEATTAMLSYQADSVEQDLHAAQDRLTGTFKDSYTQLTNDVVIPGAKAQRISAVAQVPAAGSVSVTPKHAVVLLFVNQTVIVGDEAPTDTSSVVRVAMDRAGDQWLVSGFEPI